MDKKEAAAELLKRIRARKSLIEYIRYINEGYVVSDFSRRVCDALEEFYRDVVNGLRPVLILQAPPQHGKTEIVSRMLPGWLFGKNTNLSIAGLSYGSTLASDINRDIQRIMMSEEYLILFPEAKLGASRFGTLDVAPKRNSETFEIVGTRGVYRCAGVCGPITGRRVDIGIIDDPIKNSQEALSDTRKNTIFSWYQSTFLARLSKNSGHIIMATSWAVDDLSGRVAKENKRARVLRFPAISDDGNALVPELHPIDKLLETKATLSDYFWSAMYQQSPKADGGNVFKDFGVRYWKPESLPKNFSKVVQSWDMTFKESTGSDFVVGQVWAKSGADVFLLHQTRKRMGFVETLEAVKDVTKKYPQSRVKLIEEKANGAAIIDMLKRKVPGLKPINPKDSKIARAHEVTAYWESGNVYLPHPEIAPFIKDDFLPEITSFPTAAHDDQVDAMTQALHELYPAKNGMLNASRHILQNMGM